MMMMMVLMMMVLYCTDEDVGDIDGVVAMMMVTGHGLYPMEVTY